MELMPILNDTSLSIDEMRQRAHDLGIVFNDELIDASVAFSNAQTDLQMAFRGVKATIGAELLPGLAQVTMAFADIVSGQEGASEAMEEGIRNLVEGIATAIPKILDMVNTLVSVIAEMAPGVITALVEGIVNNLPSLIDTAMKVINTIVDGIVIALPVLLEGAVEVVVALANGIADLLPFRLRQTHCLCRLTPW